MSEQDLRAAMHELRNTVNTMQLRVERNSATMQTLQEILTQHVQNHDLQSKSMKDVLDILEYLKTSMKFINFLRKGTMWLAAFVIAMAGMWDTIKRFLS